jgi:rRNA-processing protein FCF1
MGLSSLFFLDRVKLIDEFFNTTAEAMVVTKSELQNLPRLARAGYFSAADVRGWIKSGKVRLAEFEGKARKSEAAQKGATEVAKTVDRYRRMGAKFLCTEDEFLKQKLAAEGVKVLRTPDIIVHMVDKGVITRERAVEALEGLKCFDWYDPEVLSSIQQEVLRG